VLNKKIACAVVSFVDVETHCFGSRAWPLKKSWEMDLPTALAVSQNLSLPPAKYP